MRIFLIALKDFIIIYKQTNITHKKRQILGLFTSNSDYSCAIILDRSYMYSN